MCCMRVFACAQNETWGGSACESAICCNFCDVYLEVCVWLKVHGTECGSRERPCSLNNVQKYLGDRQ